MEPTRREFSDYPRFDMRPRVVSWEELVAALWPYVGDADWAISTLRDLWNMGAPVPKVFPWEPDRRVLLPRQFARWWREVSERRGFRPEPPSMP